MFTYFCCSSFCRIIFTVIYFFNQRLNICMNSCFICKIPRKLLKPSQFLERFMEILEYFNLQKQIRSLPPTQYCRILAKKLSQILENNNIDNGWREIGLRISVTYYLKNGNLQKNELWKLWEDIINFYH